MTVEYNSRIPEVQQMIRDNEQRALREIGDFVVSEAQKRVGVKTGALRDSIERGIFRDHVKIGIRKNATFSREDKFYARFQEFGTRKMRKHPYLRPAAEHNKTKIKQIAENALRID